jgi:uncharacterized membrane protein YozB (DUF420 family)
MKLSLPSLLTSAGFLGTRARLYADLSLILILCSAILFTVGWQLAVHKHFASHRWVQTCAAILNTLVVLIVMIASYIIYILPGIPGKLLESTYGVTTVHAFIGMLGLLLGVFVVLRANKLVPKRLRFKNYKLFMRTSYILYMLATLIGVIVYVTVYVTGPA